MSTIPAGHVPRPAVTNLGRCAICAKQIVWVSSPRETPGYFKHKGSTAEFDATRQKELYERIGAIAASFRSPDIMLPDLFEMLSTLYTWRMSPQVWNLIDRWCKDHGGSRRRGY
jgi:hypothetical protein